MLDRRLYLHLVTWLGQWPAGPGLHVVGSARRTRPAWDGRLRPAIGVSAPGSGVLSVPPDRVAVVRQLVADTPPTPPSPAGRSSPRVPAADRLGVRLLAALPGAVGHPTLPPRDSVFRWSTAPSPLPDVGEWVLASGPDLPSWLRLFDREILVVRDAEGRYLAGVGVKRHDRYGHEVAVGTVPAARGRGLARRLVAQAARRVLDEGGIPTYLHLPGNVASARVAEAAGFPDRGWRSYGVYPD